MSPYYIKSVIWSDLKIKIILADANNEKETRELVISAHEAWRIWELYKKNPKVLFLIDSSLPEDQWYLVNEKYLNSKQGITNYQEKLFITNGTDKVIRANPPDKPSPVAKGKTLEDVIKEWFILGSDSTVKKCASGIRSYLFEVAEGCKTLQEFKDKICLTKI